MTRSNRARGPRRRDHVPVLRPDRNAETTRDGDGESDRRIPIAALPRGIVSVLLRVTPLGESQPLASSFRLQPQVARIVGHRIEQSGTDRFAQHPDDELRGGVFQAAGSLPVQPGQGQVTLDPMAVGGGGDKPRDTPIDDHRVTVESVYALVLELQQTQAPG